MQKIFPNELLAMKAGYRLQVAGYKLKSLCLEFFLRMFHSHVSNFLL